MAPRQPLNLFYAEPDPDRWVPGDRYPRRLVRRIVRGPRRPGGQTRVYLNLRAGLERLGVPYRVNDVRHARRHPEELACIIGKPFLLDAHPWRNPILFGAATFSHPIDDPSLFERRPVRHVLVPGPWMEAMCRPYWGDAVQAWPVGIDTDAWAPGSGTRDIDVLVYDKVLWQRDVREATVVAPVVQHLARAGLRTQLLRYGQYHEEDYRKLLGRSRAMVFLCEHETQGIAYQQALASGVPLLAWDAGGPWQDPSYFPDRVVFGPVSSVPYFDARCGMRFADVDGFPAALDAFMAALADHAFDPRAYILDHLTLEACAARYVAIADAVAAGNTPHG